jgi:putative glutathione S-transferase
MADPIIDGEFTDGAFKRQQSRFRDWVGVDPRSGSDSEFPVLAGRYHLYVALACPWCHRVVIARELAGLTGALGISFLAPYRDERGWAFTGELFSVRGEHGWTDEYVDRLHGWEFMSSAYDASDPDFRGRITVPVLWDTHSGRIVNNESGDILRMLGSAKSLGGLGRAHELALYPAQLREEIDALNARIYETVNNGVYRAGFARRQEAYEQAFAELFDSLQSLETLLGERRYLAGDAPTEADWRLFPTLARFDEVYNLHFRCNRRRIVDYPNLWAYARELYQWPGVEATVAMDQIKRHYYTTHDELNPKKIIPVGPGYDWLAPHGRDR